MRNLLLGALALLGVMAVNPVQAFSLCPQSQSIGAVAAPLSGVAVSASGLTDIAAAGSAASGAIVGYSAFLGALVVCDIMDGGLNRKLADAPVGAGYQPGNLAVRDDESTRLFAAYRTIEANEMLASASR